MIETLFLQNFKALRDVEMRLQPLTMLVGPNASGKTSILQALSIISECLFSTQWQSKFKESHYAPALLTSYGSKVPVVLGCTGFTPAGKLAISLGIDSRKSKIEYLLRGSWKGQPVKEPLPRDLRESGNPATFLSLDVSKMSSPSFSDSLDDGLSSTGGELSSFLAFMSLERPDRFKEIVGRLREIVPTFKDIRFRRSYTVEKSQKRLCFELLFDMQGAEGLPAFAVSEGTLLTLGLLTIIMDPNPPSLLLIDDLERGLHPKALADLIAQIRSLRLLNPELQIVATSHSPYLLDYLEANEILLTSLDEQGYASVKALSEHPDYDRWKDVMAPGEFWSTVGESWVVQKS